ncbi:DUF4139 domain-containing protein, partial [Candidatus Woesearchaeota archaeon CG_4_10_14_0_8_um_filter_47_5]
MASTQPAYSKRMMYVGVSVIALILLVAGAVALYRTAGRQTLSMDERYFRGTQLTIYNQGLGLVKQGFSHAFDQGMNELSIEGVASQIDTSSVKLTSKQEGIELLEQNYQYDLVNKDKLMERFVGKNISVLLRDPNEVVRGTLLSYSGGEAILEMDDRTIQILQSGEYVLPEAGEGMLLLKPTLNWLIYSTTAGIYDVTLMYMTRGMSWNADYILLLNDLDTQGDFKGWVTINNNAGTTFTDAELKLLAGDVNVVSDAASYKMMNQVMAESPSYSGGAGGFQEEGMFEYHMYTLQRPATVRDKEQKQISLFEAGGIGVEKRFVYSRGDKVAVKVLFKNSEENNMGIPLPKGKVKVFKEDKGGSLQFVGEDRIDHTPKDEELELTIGNAFDIAAEKKQLDYRTNQGYYTYSYEITLRNHKDEDVVVYVEEPVYGWREWRIISENYSHDKDSQTKVVWKVPVP